jgi:hypothetical protein
VFHSPKKKIRIIIEHFKTMVKIVKNEEGSLKNHERVIKLNIGGEIFTTTYGTLKMSILFKELLDGDMEIASSMMIKYLLIEMGII